MTGFYEADDKITYPDADRLVGEYLDERGAERARVTSRDVLEWSEVPDSLHNQRRVHDALKQLCTALESDWAGRTVFRVPAEYHDS